MLGGAWVGWGLVAATTRVVATEEERQAGLMLATELQADLSLNDEAVKVSVLPNEIILVVDLPKGERERAIAFVTRSQRRLGLPGVTLSFVSAPTETKYLPPPSY